MSDDRREPSLVEAVDGGFIKLYSDGSVVRGDDPPLPSPKDDYNFVAYKDIVFHHKLGLWARVYLPPETKTRVPVLLYYHGGGFCFVSPATALFHYMCQKWAATLGVIIVSVNYRLSPEHRLPAAYHDAIAALQWIDSMKRESGGGEGEAEAAVAVAVEVDPWFQSYADFCNVFVMGDSAGGNIAHHVGIWAASGDSGNVEIQVKGMILVYPFFGGEERTPSEGQSSPVLNVEQSDVMWRLALPLGSNRDHPFCNPVDESGRTSCSNALPPMLFLIGGRDILKDKQLQYVEVLKGCGEQVEVHIFDKEDHGFTLLDIEGRSSVEAVSCISDFIK